MIQSRVMPAEAVRRIGEAVEAQWEAQLTFLRELVRTPSVTGTEGACQEIVAARYREAGLAVDVWEPDPAELAPYADHVGEFADFQGRPNVVGTSAGNGAGRSLILNGHIDTVDPGDPARWTHPPFAAEIADDRLYGRGSCDMKAGVASNLFALLAVRAAGVPLTGDVILESTISEEDGGAGALAAVLRGYRADAAIISEPTKLAIIPAQGGSLVFRLTIEGRAAHACVRNEGISAIEKFGIIHQALLDFERQRNAEVDHPLYREFANKIPINIGTVHAGNWPSSVPETLIAEGRAGLVPGEDLDAFRTEVAGVVAAAAATDPWLAEHPPRLEWFSGQFAPAEVAINSPLVQLVAGAHAAVTGSSPAVTGATYGADMRHFLLFGETSCLMYGAGDVRLAHYTDESIALAEIKTATKTLAVAIAAWCGGTK